MWLAAIPRKNWSPFKESVWFVVHIFAYPKYSQLRHLY
nr:unnamed protein product [Callosobruchus analis]